MEAALSEILPNRPLHVLYVAADQVEHPAKICLSGGRSCAFAGSTPCDRATCISVAFLAVTVEHEWHTIL